MLSGILELFRGGMGTICYWIVVLFLLFLILGALLFLNRKSIRIFDVVSNHLLIVSLGIWFFGVVMYSYGYYKLELNWLSVVPRAIISSFKMFVVTHDLARVNSVLQEDAVYMSMFSILHLLAAFITSLLVFKMIGYKMKSSLNILIHKWFKSEEYVVHLFWGINEASLLLAENIRSLYAKDKIIFIDVDEECCDNSQSKATLSNITNTITVNNSEIARLDKIDALVDHCYNGPATVSRNKDNLIDVFGTLHLNNIGDIIQKSSKSYCYFLSDNEAQNISGALTLQVDCRLCSMANKPEIYVHARKSAGNEVFDHYSQYDSTKQRMKIKIVDSAYLSIAMLKQNDNALPVKCFYDYIDKTGLVNSSFTSLIVGFGSTGIEAFKFLYEFSAFVGPDIKKTPFKCYAIDEKMNKIAGLLKAKMPAITDDELSLIQTSVDSEEFWKQISEIIKKLNYAVITLNNDNLGLSLAVNLFKYALKCRDNKSPRLKIAVRCYDNSNEKRMSEVIDNLNNSAKGYNVEIILFGKERELYSCNMILLDTILKEAKEYNRIYENSNLTAEEQWQKNFGENEITRLVTKKSMSRYHAIYDINRKIEQNISNALHKRTKMILMGLDHSNSREKLEHFNAYVQTRDEKTIEYKINNKDDATLLRNMAIVEHERWIASHKLMGYTYNAENNIEKKYHDCMKDWDKLEENIKSYDCNVVDTTIKFEYQKI